MITIYNSSVRKYVSHRGQDATIIVSIITGLFAAALFFMYGVKI